MPSNHESRSRGEIAETVENRQREYREKTYALQGEKEDIRIEREAIEMIEQAFGTLEGRESVLTPLREAEMNSQEEFTENGAALEQAQSQGRELEGELQERSDSMTAEAEHLGQAGGQVTSDASRSMLERAEAQAREDVEFLHGEEEKARESREAGEQEYNQLRQIVFEAGG